MAYCVGGRHHARIVRLLVFSTAAALLILDVETTADSSGGDWGLPLRPSIQQPGAWKCGAAEEARRLVSRLGERGRVLLLRGGGRRRSGGDDESSDENSDDIDGDDMSLSENAGRDGKGKGKGYAHWQAAWERSFGEGQEERRRAIQNKGARGMEAEDAYERMTDDTIGVEMGQDDEEEEEEDAGGAKEEESSEVPSWMDEGKTPEEIEAMKEERRGRNQQQESQELGQGYDDGSVEESGGTDFSGSGAVEDDDVDDDDDDDDDDVAGGRVETKEERIKRLKDQIAVLEGTMGKNEGGQVGDNVDDADSEVEEAERLLGRENDDDDDDDDDGVDGMLEDEVKRMLAGKAGQAPETREEMNHDECENDESWDEERDGLNLEDDSEIERLLEAEKDVAGGPERSAEWLKGPLPPPPRYEDEKHQQSPVAYLRLNRPLPLPHFMAAYPDLNPQNLHHHSFCAIYDPSSARCAISQPNTDGPQATSLHLRRHLPQHHNGPTRLHQGKAL